MFLLVFFNEKDKRRKVLFRFNFAGLIENKYIVGKKD